MDRFFQAGVLLSRLVPVAFGGRGPVNPLEEVVLFLGAMLSAIDPAWWRCSEVMSKVYL